LDSLRLAWRWRPSPPPAAAAGPPASGSRYEDLAALFADWRAFQRLSRRRRADYTEPPWPRSTVPWQACAADWRRSTPRGWPVGQQVDWHLVRAEMNGLDFESTGCCGRGPTTQRST